MRQFEEFNNRRYSLQEAIDSKGNITPEPGDIAKEKSILRQYKKKQVNLSKNERKNIKSNTQAGEQLKKEINKRLSASTTRGDQARSLYGTGSGSTEGAGGANTGTTKPNVDDSVKSVRTNRRTINKVTQPNVTRGSGSGITVNKGGGATASTSSDLNKIVNRRSTNIIDKVFGSGDTKVSFNLKEPPTTPRTITKIKNPEVKTRPQTTTTPRTITKIKNPEVKTRPQTTTTVNQVKTQTQQPLKGFKQFRADSATRGAKNVAKGVVGKASKALGIAGLALDAGVTFRDTYKRSQAQGHSKQRSIGKSLAKIGGGLVGGALGGTVGSAAGPAGSFIGAGLGYAGGKEFGARAFDKLTTQQGRDELKQSFQNFRKRAMKPAGS